MKRTNKTKEQIQADMEHTQKVAHMKDVVRKVYPFLDGVDSIYDAQTTLNAIGGYIRADLENLVKEVSVGYLALDIEKEKDSKIKSAMLAIVEAMQDEPADEFAEVIELLANTFSKFGANKFLKNPMSELKIEDIIAD